MPVDLDFYFMQPDAVITALDEAGFELIDRQERDADPVVEVDTRRAWLTARKVD